MPAVRDVDLCASRRKTICSANCWPSAQGTSRAASAASVGRLCHVPKCQPAIAIAAAAAAVNAAVIRSDEANADGATPHSPLRAARTMAMPTTTAAATVAVQRGVTGATSQVYTRTTATIAITKQLPLQRHLLRAPVPDLADPQIVLRPAIDRVHDAELLRHLARLAEPADDLSRETDLVDLAVGHALGIVRVRAEEILRRAARDADRLRRADAGNLRLERALAVEDLDALVPRVGHVDVARRVGRDAANPVGLSRRRPRLPPRLHEVAVLCGLRHAVVAADAVGDVDVAGAIPGDVCRMIEGVAVDAGARRAASAAAAAFAATPAFTAAPACGRRAFGG